MYFVECIIEAAPMSDCKPLQRLTYVTSAQTGTQVSARLIRCGCLVCWLLYAPGRVRLPSRSGMEALKMDGENEKTGGHMHRPPQSDIVLVGQGGGNARPEIRHREGCPILGLGRTC